MELNNVLKNIAGDLEADGLDLHDIRKMVYDAKLIEPEINELKKTEQSVKQIMDRILKKIRIQPIV